MRIGQGGSHIKFEIFAVVDGLLSDSDWVAWTCFDYFLEKHRLERRIEIFAYVLEQHPFTKLDRKL